MDGKSREREVKEYGDGGGPKSKFVSDPSTLEWDDQSARSTLYQWNRPGVKGEDVSRVESPTTVYRKYIGSQKIGNSIFSSFGINVGVRTLNPDSEVGATSVCPVRPSNLTSGVPPRVRAQTDVGGGRPEEPVEERYTSPAQCR